MSQPPIRILKRLVTIVTYKPEMEIVAEATTGIEAYQSHPYGSRGQEVIPPDVGEKLSERLNCPQLSQREREVLQQVAQGKSNQEIADALHLAESTLKYHVNNILSKLGVSDRTQATIVAIKRGLVNL